MKIEFAPAPNEHMARHLGPKRNQSVENKQSLK